jgi:hypothetical protein
MLLEFITKAAMVVQHRFLVLQIAQVQRVLIPYTLPEMVVRVLSVLYRAVRVLRAMVHTVAHPLMVMVPAEVAGMV